MPPPNPDNLPPPDAAPDDGKSVERTRLDWIKTAIAVSAGTILVSYIARLAALQPISDQSQGLVLARSLYPVLLIIIAVSIGISLWLLVADYATRRKGLALHRLFVWLLAISVASTALALGVALIPKQRDAVENSLVEPPAIINRGGPLIVHHPVFFPNGSSAIESDEQRTAHRFLAAVASCEEADVEAFGFASSAAYQHDPGGDKNLTLANKRAAAVVALARDEHIARAHPRIWGTPEEMFKKRGIRDISSNGARVILRELLNRRAEMVVTLPAECVDEQQAVSAQ